MFDVGSRENDKLFSQTSKMANELIFMPRTNSKHPENQLMIRQASNL